MELIIVLLVGGPLIAGIWLIISALSSKDRIAELNQRVDDLYAEVVRLKMARPPASVPTPAAPPAKPDTILQKPASPVVTPEPDPPFKPEPQISLMEPVVSPPPFIPLPSTPPPLPPLIPPLSPPPLFVPLETRPEVSTETTTASVGREPSSLSPSPAPEKTSFELRLGMYWAVRVGIVMILTCLAFAAKLAYQDIVPKLGPGGKICCLYFASGLLLAAGAWWQRQNVRESLKNYAQVLFAGGLAAVYFTTYAAHYFPPLLIIESALVDGTLLLAWAGVIAFIADRRKSEVMALFAIGLAFYSSVITRVGEFTLYSNLILTVAAVVFLVRNRWAALSFASLVTSYAGYAFWRFLHEDGWRWATPEENLRLGAVFLACYWLVFTAATFLSKSEKLSGPNRAAFLTLNNGAFFVLFLLTMLQVHTGGFWKFSLSYGTVLLALALGAKKFLPAEPLVKNAYLTQGLLLVTLGFITKFSGLQLSLVLGTESVVLYVLGSQRQSLVLKLFSFAAALLGTAWCMASLKNFDSEGLWTGGGLGALLAFNAVWAHGQETKANPASERLESTLFTLLAFACWTTTTWFNTTGPHLHVALVLGVESVVLFNLVARRLALAPKTCAYITAAFATGWCTTNLQHFDTPGLWIGIGLGVLMILNAWLSHRDDAGKSQSLLRVEPTAFTLLAFASWLATTWFNTTVAHLPLALAAEAVVLTFSIYLLRVREITLLGQFFLVLAQFAWLFRYIDSTPPWWNPLAIIAVTVGLSHWWQHQKIFVVSRNIFICYSAIFALAAVAIVLVWLHPLVSAPSWLALTSLLAVAITIYGVTTRAWPLAICGQIFITVSILEFFRQSFGVKPEWFFPLAPLAVMGILSFATVGWFTRKADAQPDIRRPLLQIALVYRWIALTMSLVWIWEYVPERQRVWTCMAAAVVVFMLAIWRSNREALVGAAVYAGAALAALWFHANLVMDVYLPNLLTLLALFALQQILRRAAGKIPLPEHVHGTIVLVAGASLWRFVCCWVPTSDIFLTMTWAGFAVLVFTAGMILRERFYRWFGLGVLAAAIGRVVLVDVWNQETIYRVLTFLVLGLALVAIGFVYNKYQDTIRKWL